MICKWIKRSVIAVVGLGAASYFMFGSHALSYVQTAASELRNSVRGEIPIEFELKRAEDLIEEIGPQIKQTKRDVARAEVRRDALAEEILDLETAVRNGEQKLRSNSVLIGGDGKARFQLAGRTWTQERIKMDLARTFDRFKQNSTMLKAKRVHFKKQNASVEAAKHKLDAIRAETMGSLGEKDAQYIRRVIAAQRYLEVGGRAALFFSGNQRARQVFDKLHSDIYETSFWQGLQEKIHSGHVEDFFPYRRELRFDREPQPISERA